MWYNYFSIPNSNDSIVLSNFIIFWLKLTCVSKRSHGEGNCKIPSNHHYKSIMIWNTSRITGPLWRVSIVHRWIPLTKRQWCSASMFSLVSVWGNCWTSSWITVFWDAITLMWRHCNVPTKSMPLYRGNSARLELDWNPSASSTRPSDDWPRHIWQLI